MQAAVFSSWLCTNGTILDDPAAGVGCHGQRFDSMGVYDIKWYLQVQVG